MQQTMFRITETLGNKILVSNVTLTDLLAVVEQREALQSKYFDIRTVSRLVSFLTKHETAHCFVMLAETLGQTRGHKYSYTD